MSRSAAHILDIVNESLVPTGCAFDGVPTRYCAYRVGMSFSIGAFDRDDYTVRMPVFWLGDAGRNYVVDDSDEGVLDPVTRKQRRVLRPSFM